MQPRQRRHLLAVEDFLAPFARHAQKMPEQPAHRSGGVLHAYHHAGQLRLKHPRRGEIEAGANLAQILLHRIGAFRAGDAETGHEPLRIGEIMVADPGQRQIGQHGVGLAKLVERGRIAGRRHAAPCAEHDPFRAPRGAGCV